MRYIKKNVGFWQQKHERYKTWLAGQDAEFMKDPRAGKIKIGNFFLKFTLLAYLLFFAAVGIYVAITGEQI